MTTQARHSDLGLKQVILAMFDIQHEAAGFSW